MANADEQLHTDRGRAESFGAVAAEYDRHRPSYPAELIDDLVALRPADVLDVGCGTGKAAVLLAARGLPVLGVEVDPQMAEVARGHGIPVEVSTFEAWPDAGRRFDLVTFAQSWHWVEPRAGAATVARVLRPGGTVARLWNRQDLPPPLRETVTGIYARFGHEVGGPAALTDRSVADPFEENEAFTGVERRVYQWRRLYTAEEWVRLVATHSDHLRMPPPVRAAVQDELRAVVEDLGGALDLEYSTILLLARRVG